MTTVAFFMCCLFVNILETATEDNILDEKSVFLRCEIRTNQGKIISIFTL